MVQVDPWVPGISQHGRDCVDKTKDLGHFVSVRSPPRTIRGPGGRCQVC